MNLGIDVRPLMTPHLTGVGEYTYELLSAVFSASSEEDEFFLLYNGQKKSTHYIPAWENPHVHYAGTRWPNKLFNVSTFFTQRPFLSASISSQRPLDLVFLPNLNFTALPKGLPYILTIHDLSFFLFPKFFSAKQRWWHNLVRPEHLIRGAHRIITPSYNTRRDVIEEFGISEDKVLTLYPGLCSSLSLPTESDLNRVKKKYNLPEKFVLFLGTTEPRKNILGVVEAFTLMKKKNPQFDGISLIIAGADGWLNKKIYSAIHRRSDIKLIGFVSAEDKAALYQCAQIFVYPSFYEGFGFPVLEAMASGTPVITSNRSSLPEITDGTAVLADPYCIHEITEAMELLLTNEIARTWYKIRGLEKAKQFSWKKTAQEFLQICRNI